MTDCGLSNQQRPVSCALSSGLSMTSAGILNHPKASSSVKLRAALTIPHQTPVQKAPKLAQSSPAIDVDLRPAAANSPHANIARKRGKSQVDAA